VKISTGPEDPRLFTFRGENYLSVFSYDNLYETSATPVTDGYGDYGTQSKLCVPKSDGLIGRMYIAKVFNVQPNPCVVNTLLPIRQTGLSFPQYSIFKNWLAFTGVDNVAAGETLFFIHRISPTFVVMRVNAITETEVDASVAYSTATPQAIRDIDRRAKEDDGKGGFGGAPDDNPDFTFVRQEGRDTAVFLTANQLAYQQQNAATTGVAVTVLPTSYDETGDSAVHGSVNPVVIPASLSPTGKAVYLSIFHTVSNDADLNYAHYAFTMCGAAPFKISGISKRLALTTKPTAHSESMCGGRPFAFVSGLALGDCTDPDSEGLTCLIMSYGVCDVESRVSEIKLAQFLDTFTTLQSC
jgi:hypothetical protein